MPSTMSCQTGPRYTLSCLIFSPEVGGPGIQDAPAYVLKDNSQELKSDGVTSLGIEVGSARELILQNLLVSVLGVAAAGVDAAGEAVAAAGVDAAEEAVVAGATAVARENKAVLALTAYNSQEVLMSPTTSSNTSLLFSSSPCDRTRAAR